MPLSRATSPQEVLSAFSNRSDELYGPRGYMSVSTRDLPPGSYRVTRLRRLDGSDTLTTADPLLRGDELPVERGGFFGEIIRSAAPVLIHRLCVRQDPVVGELLAPYQSLMAIPIFDGGVPVNWAVFLQTLTLIGVITNFVVLR